MPLQVIPLIYPRMKFSKTLIPTLREAPGDAEVISHQLLIRAGFIKKVAAGIYEFLPLGLKSLRKVEQIIREEMDRAGSLEVFMPHLVPAELWQESKRWFKYGPELLRIKDRHEHEYCFGPTHEEVVCDLVKQSIQSYKSLPVTLYQIQTKFRDEIRPRFGLMRGREFLMKDAYSFHLTPEDLDHEYQNMYQTYQRIFARCGLASRAVEADTGSIGGASSHEFMVLASTGEDVIAACNTCQYAANLEKAFFANLPLTAQPTQEVSQDVVTPNQKTIEEVSSYLNVRPSQMIKTLVYVVGEKTVIVCLAGDRDVSEAKLKALTKSAEVRFATEEEIMLLTGVPIGFLGPQGLLDRLAQRGASDKVTLFYDRSLIGVHNGVTGANKVDHHKININIERDLGLSQDPRSAKYVDLSTVIEGDACPKCQAGKLTLMRGIEVGHIFKLGDVYSQPMGVKVLDKDGQEKVAIMGCYGVGVGRTLAASIEQNHDDKGIIWPRALAPYEVYLMNLDGSDEIKNAAQNIYNELTQNGVTVLWDDRDDRAGVKFNDADLIGIPLQIMVGKKGLAREICEYKIRRDGTRGELPYAQVVSGVKDLLVKL